MTPTLEEALAASIALVNARKEAPEASKLRVMPAPAPAGSEVPAILSPTSVNTYLHDCSYKWYCRKVLKLEEARGAAVGLGTAVHDAVLANFRQKIETREDLDVAGVQAVFVNSLTEQLDTMKLQKDEAADDLKEAGEVMVRVYMQQAAPQVEPAAVEQPIAGFIGDVAVRGFIDVLDVHGRVIDIKTAKRKPSGMMPAYRLQVSTYAMLEPRASGEATIATLTKTKTVALHQETVSITPGDRKLATRLYSIAQDQMHAGLHAPNRASFLCSRKYCSFWERCEAEFGGIVGGEEGA